MPIRSREEILKILRKLEGDPASEFEDETLDFKSCPKDKKKLLRLALEYAVCFANRRGGTLVLGVNDKATGLDKVLEGCPAADIEEIKRYIYDNTSPQILVDCEELFLEGRRLVLVHIPQGVTIHTTSSGEAKIRIGRDCMPLTGELRSRLPFQRGWADFTAQAVEELDENALDPLEMERLRKVLRERSPNSPLLSQSDLDFALNLSLLKTLEGGRRSPTVAGLLIAGKEEVLREWVPTHEVIYLRFGKTETDYEVRIDLKVPILKAIERVSEAIEARNPIFTLKMGLFHFEILAFPDEVYREALLNALTHRDYTSPSSVFVRHYEDRLEISNPGGFLEGITPENIIRVEPKWRNPLLAEMFQKLRLVERAGVGVDRMFSTMLYHGKEPPMFQADKHSVKVILRNGSLDEPFARFVREEEKRDRGLGIDELLVLSALRRRREISLDETSQILQLFDLERTKEVLNRMTREGYLFIATRLLARLVRKGFLVQVGKGRGAHYVLQK